MKFHELHDDENPLLLCNVWDAQSAKIAEALNFKAIGTSSSAIAAMLGYKDGEDMSFQELLYIVQRIHASSILPLTVDLEGGYSRNPDIITENIIHLADIGVAGINIEDSVVTDSRTLIEKANFARTLHAVCSNLYKQNIDVFINVRTDAFLLASQKPVETTIERAKAYQDAGAHGLFVPCIEKVADIQQVVHETELPLNVMCVPNLPDIKKLGEIGVKRISMGNFVYNKTSQFLKKELSVVLSSNSFLNLFN